MLHLFYGEDDYNVRALGAAAVARYADESLFGAQRLDGATATWGDIVAACTVLPFLFAYQIVRVDGLITASTRRRSASGDETAKPGVSPDGLTTLIKEMPETTVLILEEPAPPRARDDYKKSGGVQAGNAHIKALAALDVPKEIRECPRLEGRARAKWVHDEVKQRGGAIESDAAASLAERLPDSLWPVSGAIDTLLAYVGLGVAITRAAVDDMVAPDEDENAFHLGDAIVEKNPGRALTVLHGLMSGGMVVEQIMAMLTGRVRDWTLLTALKAERTPEDAAMKRLGWNAGKYRMVARAAGSFGRGELPRAYQALVAADEALKSRHDDQSLILDMLVFILTTRGDPEALRAMFPIPQL
jgi:DNA polymerase III delta subunit